MGLGGVSGRGEDAPPPTGGGEEATPGVEMQRRNKCQRPNNKLPCYPLVGCADVGKAGAG